MDARRQLHLSFEFGGVAVHAGTQLCNGRSSTSRDDMCAFKIHVESKSLSCIQTEYACKFLTSACD